MVHNPIPAGLEKAVERLRERALSLLPFLAGQFPEARFRRALARAVENRFTGQTASPAQKSRFLDSIHAEDLALACACAEGMEAAWEVFVNGFRPQLYAAARAVTHGDEGRARELADSIYGELFGLEERDGERRSLFDYFHGRSRLTTWLRAILAQRFVDQVRAGRRLESLDENPYDGEGASPATHEPRAPQPPDPERQRYAAILQGVLAGVLAALHPRERLRLAYYYVHDLTLAEIGRLMNEHEATVSRKLDRLRRDLRQRVERALREEQRLSDAQVALCFEAAGEAWPFDLETVLTTEPGKPAEGEAAKKLRPTESG